RVVSVSRAERDRVWFGAETVADLSGFLRDFVDRRFDLALVPRFDVDFNGALKIAAASGAPHVVGFSERSTPRRAILNRGEDRFYSLAIDDAGPTHEAGRNLSLVKALGGAAAPGRAGLSLTAGDTAAADRFLSDAF